MNIIAKQQKDTHIHPLLTCQPLTRTIIRHYAKRGHDKKAKCTYNGSMTASRWADVTPGSSPVASRAASAHSAAPEEKARTAHAFTRDCVRRGQQAQHQQCAHQSPGRQLSHSSVSPPTGHEAMNTCMHERIATTPAACRGPKLAVDRGKDGR